MQECSTFTLSKTIARMIAIERNKKMTNEVLIALLALVGTLVGSGSGILISNKLVNYRIEQLEKKVDKYAERDDEVIRTQAVMKRDLETAFIRIDELRDEVNKIKE